MIVLLDGGTYIYRGAGVLRDKTPLDTYDSLQYIISILSNIS
jgi:hypothetical protein